MRRQADFYALPVGRLPLAEGVNSRNRQLPIEGLFSTNFVPNPLELHNLHPKKSDRLSWRRGVA
jgi:hypothetical protein